MKGIVLAGGSGTRLYPITQSVSKQLLPVYDKPMIYYPISVLMLAGITEILIISTPEDLPNFKKMLGDGSRIGVSFSYIEQPSPDGLAQAFILGENFLDGEDACLILGDNIFYGHGIVELMESAKKNVAKKMATIFGYNVNNPQSYGVVEFDSNQNVLSLEEKPKLPKSNHAIVGLYFYPNEVVEIAKKVKPSERGELEITSVNNAFFKKNSLRVELMGRGFAWLDTGSHDSLLEAGCFIQTLEKRQGLKVACLEEIAFQKGYITEDQLASTIQEIVNTNYSKYLKGLIKENGNN